MFLKIGVLSIRNPNRTYTSLQKLGYLLLPVPGSAGRAGSGIAGPRVTGGMHLYYLIEPQNHHLTKSKHNCFDLERRTGEADVKPCRLRRCEMERARFDDARGRSRFFRGP